MSNVTGWNGEYGLEDMPVSAPASNLTWTTMHPSFFKQGGRGYMPQGHPGYKGSCCEAFELYQAAENAVKRKADEQTALLNAQLKAVRNGWSKHSETRYQHA